MLPKDLAVVCSKREPGFFTALFKTGSRPFARVAIQAADGMRQTDLETLARRCLLGNAPAGWEDGDQFSVQYCR